VRGTKCDSCKEALVNAEVLEPLEVSASTFLDSVNRGGLVCPAEYAFELGVHCWCVFKPIRTSQELMSQFFTAGHQRTLFSKVIDRVSPSSSQFISSPFFFATNGQLQRRGIKAASHHDWQECQVHLSGVAKNETAGDQWAGDFMQRHQNISLHTPETTSIARSQAFNWVSVSRLFTLPREQLEKHDFKVNDVDNVDETAVRTSATRPLKITAQT